MSQFSTNEQVQKAYDFLHAVPTPQCSGCNRGIRMCYNVPCIPSVEDAEKLLDAGYAKKLMLDWWVGLASKEKALKSVLGRVPGAAPKKERENPFPHDVPYLVPAIEGLEGKKAPFSRGGKCNLLVNNQCSLHSLGLKPVQGRIACCKVENMYFDHNGRQQPIDERIAIFHTWNTQRGQDLISRWKEEVNYVEEDDENEDNNLPMTKESMMEGVLEMFKYIAGSQFKVEGCPEVTEEEKNYEEKVVMHEKPY